MTINRGNRDEDAAARAALRHLDGDIRSSLTVNHKAGLEDVQRRASTGPVATTLVRRFNTANFRMALVMALTVISLVASLAFLVGQIRHPPVHPPQGKVAQPSSSTQKSTPSPGSKPAGGTRQHWLAELEPTAGNDLLLPAPNRRTLRVACTDGQSIIAYPQFRYDSFAATVRAGGSAPQGTHIQIRILAGTETRGVVLLTGDKAAYFTADLPGTSSTLHLEVTCESPNAFLDLEDATLTLGN